jgi:hypothetical protein
MLARSRYTSRGMAQTRKIRMVRKMHASTLSHTARSITAHICAPRTSATRSAKTQSLRWAAPTAREVVGLLVVFALIADVATLNVWLFTR